MAVKFVTAEHREVRSEDGKRLLGLLVRNDGEWLFSPRLEDMTYQDLEMVSHHLRVINGAVQ